MPDLTLDEFRGLSEEQLKRVLREEAIRAGFAEECSYHEEAALPGIFCGQAPGSGAKEVPSPAQKSGTGACQPDVESGNVLQSKGPQLTAGGGKLQYCTLATGKNFAGKR